MFLKCCNLFLKPVARVYMLLQKRHLLKGPLTLRSVWNSNIDVAFISVERTFQSVCETI